MSQPRASKARRECLLRTAIAIREKYQARLHNLDTFPDLDFERSLTEVETKSLHNAWMNDVESRMSEECFEQYERLIEKANQLDSNKGAGKLGPTPQRRELAEAKAVSEWIRRAFTKAVLESLLSHASSGLGSKLSS